MIVKVQISLASSDGQSHMLVYNETQDYFYQGPVTKEVLDVMKGAKKKFFTAILEGTKITLIKEVSFKNW